MSKMFLKVRSKFLKAKNKFLKMRGNQLDHLKKNRRSKASIHGRDKKNMVLSKSPAEMHMVKCQEKKQAKFGPKSSEVYKIMTWFDISNDCSVTSSGFKGSRTSSWRTLLKGLEESVRDGRILKIIEGFQQIPYQGVCTRICDSEGI